MGVDYYLKGDEAVTWRPEKVWRCFVWIGFSAVGNRDAGPAQSGSRATAGFG